MTDNSQSYTTRRFTAAHLPLLAGLYYVVYNQRIPVTRFQKKYDTKYTGRQYIGYLAFAPDGTVVGYYGVIPCLVEYDGQELLAAQSADTMTHPQYRFKGLFVELSQLTFGLCKQEGIQLLFGFPNQHSVHGAIHKLGWQIAHTMDAFTIPIPVIPFGKLSGKHGWLPSLYERYRQVVTRRNQVALHGIDSSVKENGFATVVRNQAYLGQKHNKQFVWQIGNALVWLRPGRVITVGDMQVLPTDFHNAITRLKRKARLLGIQEIRFQLSPGTTLHRLLAENYTPVPAFPVLFQLFAPDIDISRFRFTFADIDIF